MNMSTLAPNHQDDNLSPQTKRVSAGLIETIRAASPIEQITSDHVQLRRSGAQLVGRCPFHADNTPSFFVHPGKQVFRCHGCGVGGDVFRFVELLHQCSFRRSVEFLAARAGVRVDGFKPSPELIAKVAALKTEREEQMRFERFCNDRVRAVNQRYRDL